ncbi:glycoside hydrolase family 43 protein [Sediminibacterium sp.]|uniref:glycoside hydrolase family 43 protein n=1 Tax=Sediminibacterium sp. TaxID=1917865 RepID=UPI0025D5A96B|nr:glycoside hydrolase family 43 protein [Sediminibacterium sp.]MBW0177917.1 glycoside hydrolase family 43 protein [Sediminibacterium sp.]
MRKLLSAILLYTVMATGSAQSFQNPILAGYYPDPSICRAGDDYYIVNSSFAYYPGLPLFHSKDLLNWKQIGYAMNRPEQLNLDGAGVSRGLFAPAISYHNGTFYIVCTEVSKLGNFVITAKDPKGPWSNPVKLPQVNGIDPSLFFDDNGKAYILFNSIPPNNISLHNGHRTIRMFEFDPVNLKVIGEEKLLINGGTDMAKKPVWIEAPHFIKKDGWYYLICAEGGTGYDHSEVVFRSKSPEGPFVSYEKNPILTQRQLDPKRKYPVTTAGHADFVEGKDGKWWGVFLACRAYEDDYYNTGRETFMAPVVWKDGWPEFDLGGDEVKYSYPINAKADIKREPFNGNYHFKDEFSQSSLNIRYQFLRTVRNQWYSLTEKPGSLSMQLQPETCSGKGNPSFLAFHQPHLKGYASTALNFTAKAANEKAGLLLFQNEKISYYLCKSVKDGKEVVELFKADTLVKSEILNSNTGNEVYFKIEARTDAYAFYFATQKDKWILLADGIDARYLSTKSAGGFVGCVYAMYATSNGKPTDNKALYNWFEIKNNDDVYKQ